MLSDMTKNSLVITNFHKNSGSGRNHAKIILAEILNTPANTLHFGETENGKPFLLNYPDLYMSISHSKDILSVYLGDTEAGIDVERICPRSSMSEIAALVFSDEQNERIAKAGSDATQVFYTYWTQREAELKKTGGTFSDLFSRNEQDHQHFKHWILNDEYMLCLCADEPTLATIQPVCIIGKTKLLRSI